MSAKPVNGPIEIGDVQGLQAELDRINATLTDHNARISTLETPTEPPVTGTKAVLTPEHLKFVGEITLNLGGEFSIGTGLAIRARDNSFLTHTHYPVPASPHWGLVRIAIPEIGATVTGINGEWRDPWGGKWDGSGSLGLYYDDKTDRLWSTSARDYPDDAGAADTRALVICELRDDGSVVSRGRFGIKGITARRWHGGITCIPKWFQDKHSCPPYLTGFGGYLSRISSGVAMGPTAYAIPSPIEANLPDGGEFEQNQIKVLADPGINSWSPHDWYVMGQPASYDRGSRIPGKHFNFYDSGTFHDESTITNWKTAPDGQDRWTWGDTYAQNVIWIDTPTHHGLLAGLVARDGHTWYENSTLHAEAKTTELHLYDPNQFSEVLQGKRQPFSVKPAHMWRPAEIPPSGPHEGNTIDYSVVGICQHPTTGLIYMRRTFVGGAWPNTQDKIYVYRVDTGNGRKTD